MIEEPREFECSSVDFRYLLQALRTTGSHQGRWSLDPLAYLIVVLPVPVRTPTAYVV